MVDEHGHPESLLAELALGVLAEDEAVAVRHHVAACLSCRAEYEEMERVAALLPFGIEEAAPPDGLRQSILKQVASDAHQLRSTPVVLKRRPVFWWAAAAASALIVASVAAFVGYAASAGPDKGNDRAEQVVEAAARGDLELARAADGDVSMTFVHAPGAREGFLWVHDLPPLPSGKAYQAWFTPDLSTFEPSTVFTLASGGAWLKATGPLDGFVAMGLTIEDKDGADAPSSAPFIVVMLEGSAQRR